MLEDRWEKDIVLIYLLSRLFLKFCLKRDSLALFFLGSRVELCIQNWARLCVRFLCYYILLEYFILLLLLYFYILIIW